MNGKTVSEIAGDLERGMVALAGGCVVGEPQKPGPVDMTLDGREYTMIPEGDVAFPEDGGPPTLAYRIVPKRLHYLMMTLKVGDDVRMELPDRVDGDASWGGYFEDRAAT